VLAAVAGGAAIALAWAIPAGRHGGPAYADAIFVRQTADRMVHAFAHRRPVWWYLPWFPALLLPWAAWPAAWRAARGAPRLDDRGVRFVAAWAIPVFLGFSLVSGKQVHYLLPLLPAVALALARALDGQPAARHVPRATLALALALSAAELVSPRFLASEDLRPWAARMATLEREGYAIGHADHYAGQYHFLGRLERPFVELPRRGGESWLTAGPRRALVSYPHRHGADPCPSVGRVLASGPYRGHRMCISVSRSD
jgi:4-amino-4-deoxy-L-arabinose transferase-like glycosyltransferase